MSAMNDPDLIVFCLRERYPLAVWLPDRRIAFITETVVGQAQLGISNGLDRWSGVAERYSYNRPIDAIIGLAEWEGRGFDGEPAGWIRHIPSDRRRTNGDPTTEEIRP